MRRGKGEHELWRRRGRERGDVADTLLPAEEGHEPPCLCSMFVVFVIALATAKLLSIFICPVPPEDRETWVDPAQFCVLNSFFPIFYVTCVYVAVFQRRSSGRAGKARFELAIRYCTKRKKLDGISLCDDL